LAPRVTLLQCFALIVVEAIPIVPAALFPHLQHNGRTSQRSVTDHTI
jgi:hypothetical protein